MREHVIPQKVGNRSGMAARNRSGSMAQRPVRRGRDGSREAAGGRLRVMLRYIPSILKFAIVIAFGVLLFVVYKAAASASFFELRTVEIQGTARASADAVQAIVRNDVAGGGVWQADLREISLHLQRLLWVRSAIVSRVLPDGIRVRISERVPRAVVRLSSGRFAWVDDDAVILGEMQATDEMPPFFMRGWNEDASETARADNAERVRKYLELRRLWDGAGLSERVSEVNLVDIRDVRAQLAGDDSQIEVRLGPQDLGNRLQKAVEVLDVQRQTSRGPFISYVDVTQGKRAIVGFISGARALTDGSSTAQTEQASAKGGASAARTTAPQEKAKRNREEKPRDRKKPEESRRKGTR